MSSAPRIADGKLLVGDIEASALAARHGTPLYALDLQVVRTNFERFPSAVAYRPLHVLYSCKANANVELMRFLRELGAGIDACSPGDVAFARAAGFGDDEISYTGHGMTDAELELVAGSPMFFTADSLDQLERIGAADPGRRVGIRVNCGIEAGFHAHVRAGGARSKFGIHREQLDEARAVARRHRLEITRLHGHIGSDIQEPGPHLTLLDGLLDAARHLPDVTAVNLGGGWGTPFLPTDRPYDFDAFGRAATTRLERFAEATGRRLDLLLEPGAYVVMDAGVLLTRVTELKPPVTVAGEETPFFACTDTSHNALVSAVIYDTYHPIWVVDRADAPPARDYHVTGNLMQSGDIIAADRALPELARGDVLAVGKCGGYAASRAPNFNERPRAAEVLVNRTDSVITRRAETEADLLATQCP